MKAYLHNKLVSHGHQAVYAFFVGAVGLGTGVLASYIGFTKVLMLWVGLLTTLLFMTLPIPWLVVFLLLSLAASSSSFYVLQSSMYYARFYLLALLAVRGMASLFARSDSTSVKLQSFHFLALILMTYSIYSGYFSVDGNKSLLRAISFTFLLITIFATLSQDNFVKYISTYVTIYSRFIGGMVFCGFVLMPLSLYGNTTASRLKLFFMNPNLLGHLCAFILPLLVFNWFTKAKKIDLVLMATVLIALVWSGSRGAMLAVSIALMFQFAFSFRKHMAKLLLALGLVISMRMLFFDSGPLLSFVSEKFLRVSNISSGSGRTDIWSQAWHLFSQNPLWGYGFASTEKLFLEGKIVEKNAFQGSHIHNSYLEELINMGYVGASILFLLLFMVLTKALRHVWSLPEGSERVRFVALVSCMVVGLLSAVFESWFTAVGSLLCFPFWVTISMIIGTMYKNDSSYQTHIEGTLEVHSEPGN